MSKRAYRLPVDDPRRMYYWPDEVAEIAGACEKSVRKWAKMPKHWLYACVDTENPSELVFLKARVDRHRQGLPAVPPEVATYPALRAVR